VTSNKTQVIPHLLTKNTSLCRLGAMRHYLTWSRC